MVDDPHVYRFADVVLDGRNRTLTRAGVDVYLPPKTFETLLVLVQHHGQLVTKSALLDAVWPETAVTDNALTQQISELREVLGDQARHPRYIRTLPRVGFSFIAAVERAPSKPAPTGIEHDRAGKSDPPSASPGPGPRDAGLDRWVTRAHRPGLVALAVAVAAGSGWFAWRPAEPFSRLELVSSLPGLHRSPSLSPDGRTVAYISDLSGTSQVWVKALAGGDPVQITSHQEPVARPRWSVQGDRIVYSVQGKGIWSVPPLGGSPRQLVTVGWNPDLSPDGLALVFERRWEIWTANVDGTDERRVPMRRQGYLSYFGDVWPTFSPDGKRIAVFLGEKGPNGDYWIMSTDGATQRQLTFDTAEGGPPAWTPDGKQLVVSSARAGSVTLWRVPVDGGAPEALTTGAGEDVDPVISPDGHRLLFANVKRTWSVVVHDTTTGNRRMLFETRTSLGCPRFSWDGRLIAFFGKNQTGDTHLFTIDAATGGGVRSVTAGRGELNVMPQWSHDDRALFYYQVRPSPAFRRIPATGGPSQSVAAWVWDREHEASTDPSSDRVVYSVLDRGRLQETRVRRLEDSRDSILAGAVFEPQFSRDGRFIAGESRGQTVMVCEIAGACRALTGKVERGLTAIGWSADGARVFYLQRTDREGWGELKSITVEGGAGRSYGSLGPLRPYEMCVGISPRDEVVFAPYREGPHELWMAQLR